jgi:hypothetical protein
MHRLQGAKAAILEAAGDKGLKFRPGAGNNVKTLAINNKKARLHPGKAKSG